MFAKRKLPDRLYEFRSDYDAIQPLLSSVALSEETERILLLALDEPTSSLILSRFAIYAFPYKERKATCVSFSPSLPSEVSADMELKKKAFYNKAGSPNCVVKPTTSAPGIVHRDAKEIFRLDAKENDPPLALALDIPGIPECGLSVYLFRKPGSPHLILEIASRSTLQFSIQPKLPPLVKHVFFFDPLDYCYNKKTRSFIHKDGFNKAREYTLAFHLQRSLNFQDFETISRAIHTAISKLYIKHGRQPPLPGLQSFRKERMKILLSRPCLIPSISFCLMYFCHNFSYLA